LRNALGRDDPWMLLGTLAVGVGAGIGVVGQLFYLGAKEIAVTVVAEVDILSDVVTAVGAAILTPIWAVTTARGLPAAPKEVVR
jgi:hypothetical protein